jgi:hypothetical protein
MRIHTLESSGLTKHEELIMYKVVLNSVQFVDVIYTNETFRTEGREENVLLRCSLYDVLCHIKDNLGSNTLGEDGGLGDVELQTSILL